MHHLPPPSTPSRPRTGGLRAVRVLLTVLLVVYGLVLLRGATLLFGHGLAVIDGESLESVFGARVSQLQPVDPGVEVSSVTVSIRQPTPVQTAVSLLAHGAGLILLIGPILVFARRLVGRAIRSDPITADMARGLRALGWLVLGSGLFGELVRGLAAIAQRRDEIEASAIALYLLPRNWWWLPLGLAVLAFAQIVARACVPRAHRLSEG